MRVILIALTASFILFVAFLHTVSNPDTAQLRRKELRESMNNYYQNQIITLVLHGDNFKVKKIILSDIPLLNWIVNNSIRKYHIDRSAHQFKHILAWAVDHDYEYPQKYKAELKHYGIDEKLVKFAKHEDK